MTLERHHQDHDDGSGNPSPLRRQSARREELRQRAGQVSQAAQDAIAKALQAGSPQEQLDGIRNTGGQ